ncbi:EDRF1 [Symbiodinium necroappetens]|uniref:EDRF1 protein n=1 Tax=Symbiodinium necroappetens TaxID=1628268 RepID=A0A812R808_9DINO|nr:EDRF1 [Symbiodinium necroappetens]
MDVHGSEDTSPFHPRRTRSWSPALSRSSSEVDDDEEAKVLFDACRFPRAGDLLDWVVGEEPWQRAETCDGSAVRVVGETSALKRLFELPLKEAGEALALHRIGNCLVVLDAGKPISDDEEWQQSASFDDISSPRYSPRQLAASRCQVRVDGDMVRVFPTIQTAEPVNVDSPSAPATPCCEWHVREGLSLVAVTSMTSGNSLDSRSSHFLLLDRQSSVKGLSIERLEFAGNLIMPQPDGPSLPRYHRRVTEDRTVVLVVPLNSPLETRTLIDSWLSCCLQGSPSLLCFFVDTDGICRGCRFVLAADIPHLEEIAKAYRVDEQRCLVDEDASSSAFDPTVLREASHSLLEALVHRCDRDGGHFLLVPGPLGPRLFAGPEPDDECEDEVSRVPGLLTLPSSEYLEPPAALAQSAPLQQKAAEDAKTDLSPSSHRLRAVLVTKALLSYHAAVRLAQSPMTADTARLRTELKHVPSGARWTAKSCCHPIRVRQMMLRSVRALRSATLCAEDGSAPPPLPCRFQLLLASAFEFLADTFLAEDEYGDVDLDLSRTLSALRHLQRSRQHVTEYCGSVLPNLESRFGRSVRQLEERIHAKAINAHLCLARLRQRHSFGLGMLGSAMKELDAAEDLVVKPRAGQSQRAGPYESSLLGSICKWKADLLHELATLVLPGIAPGQELDPEIRSYLEAQVKSMNESMQPPATQCERWLQSTVSLCLRSLHQLAVVPNEVASELQLQVRALLGRAYSKLGRLYASTGRFTKAMTHAKQGIELFNATKDKLEAAKLQIWLCRLQLRMAVPQAASYTRSTDCHFLDKDPGLLSGLSAAAPTEEIALQQVVQQLQKALSALDSTAAPENQACSEGQVLLGKVFFRQALVRLAKAGAPLKACGRLGEEASEDAIFVSALDILESEAKLGQSGKEDSIVKEAMERLHQAATCFRSADAPVPCCSVHACCSLRYKADQQ